MSVPISFTPRHAQPFSLEEAMQLEVETLVTEINRLRNSISHLRRTRTELVEYLDSDEGRADADEVTGEGEITKAVRENDQVIASQNERIALITVALSNKLGSETRLEHYGLQLGGREKQAAQKPSGGVAEERRHVNERDDAEREPDVPAAPVEGMEGEGLHL
ncbi:hypothetical protein IAU60_006482 [Kwoniella sp. DSM 27419]